MVQDIIQFTRLARPIHEFCSFVNRRLQENKYVFLQASTRCYTPCSGLTLSGGLWAEVEARGADNSI